MGKQVKLECLEVEITEACNLVCLGCTNYSDYEHSSWITWEIGQIWFDPWVNRINPINLSLLGGEPLLNPEFDLWLVGVRKLFPESCIHISTNGTLIYKKSWILDLMVEIGNCVLSISSHLPKNRDFLASIEVIGNYKHWHQNNNIYAFKDQMQYFSKTYKGDFINMKPYNSQPENAFEICTQPKCAVLYNSCLFKCCSSAKLSMVLEDWGHINDPDWNPYLQYRGLQPYCTDEELLYFANNHIGHPDKICGMCPEPEDNPFFSHRNNVWTKSSKRIIPLKKIADFNKLKGN